MNQGQGDSIKALNLLQGTTEALTDHSAQSCVEHLSLNHSKGQALENEQLVIRNEITQLSSENETLKKTIEEQNAIFRTNVDDLRRQLSGEQTINQMLIALPAP